MYARYWAWVLPSHFSIPTLKQSPQTMNPYHDKSDQDPGEPNSKRNYSSFSMPGKMELD